MAAGFSADPPLLGSLMARFNEAAQAQLDAGEAGAWAALEGRDFVTPDDIKALAGPVLAHRLIASPSARIRGVDAASIVSEILGTTAVPGADAAVA